MSAPGFGATYAKPLCLVTVVVTAVLATLGSFSRAFGVMSDCTDRYGCSTSGCAPCSATGRWIVASWVIQGALLVCAVALGVLVRRGRHAKTLAVGALTTLALSLGSFAATGWQADHSYCQPGQTPADMTGATASDC